MADLVFHERVGFEGLRISPFSWRIRYALAHKGLSARVSATRFADVDRIAALSGQTLVPILENGPRVIADSWAIACHLEDEFPDRPSLFGNEGGRGVVRFLNNWCDSTLHPPLRRVISADFLRCLDPGDRAYFRISREKTFGQTLEEACSEPEKWLSVFWERCRPLEQTLGEQPFLSGSSVGYADYVVFSVFQWARFGSPRDILEGGASHTALQAWRRRMIEGHGNEADRFRRGASLTEDAVSN